MMHHRYHTFKLWHNVASRWKWVTDNETGVKILFLLSSYQWCVSTGWECNLGWCMCGLARASDMMHHRHHTLKWWRNVARRWKLFTNNETGVKVLLPLLSYLRCPSA